MLVSSPPIIGEIVDVLESPRISKKHSIRPTDIKQLADLLDTDTIIVPGRAAVAGAVPQDPRDEIFLACAVDSNADCIVSGDRHLLDIETYRDIPILTVKAFSERLEKQTPSRDTE
jgi:putative PIN family toxin of toxin-antitoxin system